MIRREVRAAAPFDADRHGPLASAPVVGVYEAFWTDRRRVLERLHTHGGRTQILHPYKKETPMTDSHPGRLWRVDRACHVEDPTPLPDHERVWAYLTGERPAPHSGGGGKDGDEGQRTRRARLVGRRSSPKPARPAAAPASPTRADEEQESPEAQDPNSRLAIARQAQW